MTRSKRTRLALEKMFHKESTTLKDLQSLIGLLYLSCSVVVPGRAFLRRLIDLTCGLSESNSKIQLSVESKADISTWLHVTFIKSFHRKNPFFAANIFIIRSHHPTHRCIKLSWLCSNTRVFMVCFILG